MYQHWMGEQRRASLAGAIAPRKFVYVLCLQNVGRVSMLGDKLFGAGRHMLRANLQEKWLSGCQELSAATWLKIVYGLREPDLDPVQTILRAYDDMSGVDPLHRKQVPASAWRWLSWRRKWRA